MPVPQKKSSFQNYQIICYSGVLECAPPFCFISSSLQLTHKSCVKIFVLSQIINNGNRVFYAHNNLFWFLCSIGRGRQRINKWFIVTRRRREASHIFSHFLPMPLTIQGLHIGWFGISKIIALKTPSVLQAKDVTCLKWLTSKGHARKFWILATRFTQLGFQ